MALAACRLAVAQQSADPIPDLVGEINAWRMIPGVLLERCASRALQTADARRKVYDAWRQANKPLIERVDRIVESSVPIFASEMTVDNDEARRRVARFTTMLIDENYFGKERGVTPGHVCASYGNIVAPLSSAGTTAKIRGLTDSLEQMIADRPKAAKGAAD